MIRAVFYFEDDSVTIHSENTKLVEKKFQSGYYKTSMGNEGNVIIKRVEFPETHEPFPNQKSSEILDGVRKFLDEKSKVICNEMGFTYKLNTLLYGKQGVGKTALINYVTKGLIENYEAIAFRVDSPQTLDISWTLAEEIRKIQDNLIVFVLDEFDAYVNKGDEAYVKNLLDGNRSINNSIVFAATNYIDRIPVTFKERPSRFRFVSEIHPITDKTIIKNLIMRILSKTKSMIFSEEAIDALVKDTKSTTIDDIKTLILDKVLDIQLGLPTIAGVGFNNKKVNKDSSDLNEFVENYNMLVSSFGRIESPKIYGGAEINRKKAQTSLFNHESGKLE